MIKKCLFLMFLVCESSFSMLTTSMPRNFSFSACTPILKSGATLIRKGLFKLEQNLPFVDLFSAGYVGYNVFKHIRSVDHRYVCVIKELNKRVNAESNPSIKKLFIRQKEQITALSDELNDSFKTSMLVGVIANGFLTNIQIKFPLVSTVAASTWGSMPYISRLNNAVKKAARLINDRELALSLTGALD